MKRCEKWLRYFRSSGLTEEQTWPIVEALRRQSHKWIDFMMRFELGLERPDPKRALTSAITIGGAYAAGGFVPLAPYMFTRNTTTALFVSIGTTLLRVVGFWVHQRTLHRHAADAQRPADGADRKRGGGRCFHDRESDILRQWSVASGQFKKNSTTQGSQTH